MEQVNGIIQCYVGILKYYRVECFVYGDTMESSYICLTILRLGGLNQGLKPSCVEFAVLPVLALVFEGYYDFLPHFWRLSLTALGGERECVGTGIKTDKIENG